MLFFILLQLIYAIYRKASEAKKLDAALLGGTTIILADYFNMWWLLDIQMLLFIMGEFYMIIKLRELQDTGTHPFLKSVYLAIALL